MSTQNNLWRLALIAGFGRGSSRPFRTSVMRTGVIIGGAAICGWGFRLLIGEIPGLDLISVWWLGATASFMVWVITAIFLFVISSSIIPSRSNNGLARQSMLWPIGPWARLIIAYLPFLIVWVSFNLLLCLPYEAVASQTRLSPVAGPACYILGSIGALATVLGSIRLRATLGAALFVSVTMALSQLLYLGFSWTPTALTVDSVLVLTMICCSWLGFWALWRNLSTPQIANQDTRHMNLVPDPFVSSSWFVSKILRNKRTNRNLIVCFGVSLLFSTVVVVRHFPGGSYHDLALVVAGIVSLLAIDIRGITRRYKPPETYDLGGLVNLLKQESIAAIFMAVAILIPLLISLTAEAAPLQMMLEELTGLVIGASLIGLCVGSALVTEVGEIGSQTIAGFLALSVDWLALKLIDGHIMHNPAVFGAVWVCIGVPCILLSLGIETRRMSHYGYA